MNLKKSLLCLSIATLVGGTSIAHAEDATGVGGPTHDNVTGPVAVGVGNNGNVGNDSTLIGVGVGNNGDTTNGFTIGVANNGDAGAIGILNNGNTRDTGIANNGDAEVFGVLFTGESPSPIAMASPEPLASQQSQATEQLHAGLQGGLEPLREAEAPTPPEETPEFPEELNPDQLDPTTIGGTLMEVVPADDIADVIGGSGIAPSIPGDNGNAADSVVITASGDVIAVDDLCQVDTENLNFDFDQSDTGQSAPTALAVSCGTESNDRAIYLSTTDVADPMTEGTDSVGGTIGGESVNFAIEYEQDTGTYQTIAQNEVGTVSAASSASVNLRSVFDRDTHDQGGTVAFNEGSSLYVYFE